MESITNTAADVSVSMDSEGNPDGFEKVKSKKSQKRKRDAGDVDMDTGAVKRPSFPPISGDQLRVLNHIKHYIHVVWYYIKRDHELDW